MTNLERIGFQDGVSDHDNGLPFIDKTLAELGDLYLAGYKKGYAIAATKSWYMISLDKVTNKINSYLVDLGAEGNTWTDDKTQATKFKTREAVTKRLNEFSCGRGNYGMTWE